MMEIKTGGLRATLAHKSLWRRGIFGIGLTLFQRFCLWYEYAEKIPKEIREIVERFIHVQICVGRWDVAKKWGFANQTSPSFLISFWDEKDFGAFKKLEMIFMDPNFPMDWERESRLREFAFATLEDGRKRWYDYADLIRFVLNTILWVLRDLRIETGRIISGDCKLGENAPIKYPRNLLEAKINKLRIKTGQLIGADLPRTWGRDILKRWGDIIKTFVCSSYVRAAYEFMRLSSGINPGMFKLRGEVQAYGEAKKYLNNCTSTDGPDCPDLDRYDIEMTAPYLIAISGLWELKYNPGIKAKYREIIFNGVNNEIN